MEHFGADGGRGEDRPRDVPLGYDMPVPGEQELPAPIPGEQEKRLPSTWPSHLDINHLPGAEETDEDKEEEDELPVLPPPSKEDIEKKRRQPTGEWNN